MSLIRYITILMILLLFSCIKEDKKSCEIYLEFRFDHNMEYTDSFDPHVPTVDIFVFDDAGKFLFSRHADCRSELNGGRRMTLTGLPFATYHILTVGGLTDKFLVGGLTSIQEFRLALSHNGGQVYHQFGHLWFGETTSIDYRADGALWPVYLLRNTNNFHLLLHNIEASEADTGQSPAYTFKITAPEAGIYGFDNLPVTSEKLIYAPHYLDSGTEPGDLAVAKINTMRLIADDPAGYRLTVYRTATGEPVWDYDLIPLLEKTKPNYRPDGTQLPLQEYLDRQGEWNIVLICGPDQPGADVAFTAIYLHINGSIVWAYDIEV